MSDKKTTNQKFDSIKFRTKIYDLLVQGHNRNHIIKIMGDEDNMNEYTCINYIQDLRKDIKIEYEYQVEILRETIVMNLFKIMNNDCKTVWEKFKAIELITKYTGIDDPKYTGKKEEDNSTGQGIIVIEKYKEIEIDSEIKKDDNNV